MKIALVYDAIYPFVHGGAERRFYEIGRRLVASHEVHLIGWSYPGAGPMLEGMQLRSLGPAPELHGANGRRRLTEAALFSGKLAKFLSREHFDVIDCCAIPYGTVYASSVLKRSAGLVVTWHEFLGERWKEYMPRLAPLLRVIELQSARLGDHRIAVSNFTSKRLPSKGPKLSVVDNGVNLALISDAPSYADGPDVLFVGRLMPHKRLDLVLEALRRTDTGLTMAIVGSGPDEARLRRMASDLGVDGRIRFMSNLDDSALFGLMKSSGILVQPSEQEGQSIIVREAMACGLPSIVASGRFTAASENLEDGLTGLVVAPDPDAFASALVSVLAKPHLRASLSENARRESLAFDWSLSTSKTEAIYRTLLQN